ncbi:MAG TPA: hypothetical protein VL358_02495 [Caulobacteraceae bacterium]|jgi:hypothetical protein|nr:hypothetical protein [Caulobacteraceae bacterium]
MLKTVLASCAAACALHGAALAAGHPNFTGLWQTPAFVPALKTTAGKTPPLRPEALKLYKQRVADRAAGRKVDDPIDACVPHGVPRLMFAPYPLLIVQSGDFVGMVQEANHTQRLIYIDQPQVEPDDPKWLGHSVARWDGATLVVDTVNNDHRTWLDKAGLPHSDDMRVTERLRLGPGGKTLTDTITIDDPKTYTAPWTTVARFNRKPGPMDLKERLCSRDHAM